MAAEPVTLHFVYRAFGQKFYRSNNVHYGVKVEVTKTDAGTYSVIARSGKQSEQAIKTVDETYATLVEALRRAIDIREEMKAELYTFASFIVDEEAESAAQAHGLELRFTKAEGTSSASVARPGAVTDDAPVTAPTF